VERTFKVLPQLTTTSLSTSSNPSVLNAAVTFTALVSSSAGVPPGSVQWQIDGVNTGPAVALDATGRATYTTSTLSVTDATGHTVVATYSGASGYESSSDALSQRIRYAAGGACEGDAGHAILQPVDADGTSVFKAGSTVAAKFRVCDANDVSIGSPGVVSSFRLTQVVNGTAASYVDEPVNSNIPDSAFRWDPGAQQWIFNISTKGLATVRTYYYAITLNDGSQIQFRFGLR
jgi:hypothetical protein